jgi:hypothetical protein
MHKMLGLCSPVGRRDEERSKIERAILIHNFKDTR